LSGVIICPAKRTAVIRRTPSPLPNNTFDGMEVNPRLPACSGGKNGASVGRDPTPPWALWVAARARCGGKPERRKSDSGKGRNDTPEREIGETPRRTYPSHVRSKCAASPCCRTFRNAHRKHIRWELPRRKNARRTPGNARGAAVSLPPDNP